MTLRIPQGKQPTMTLRQAQGRQLKMILLQARTKQQPNRKILPQAPARVLGKLKRRMKQETRRKFLIHLRRSTKSGSRSPRPQASGLTHLIHLMKRIRAEIRVHSREIRAMPRMTVTVRTMTPILLVQRKVINGNYGKGLQQVE